MSTRQGYIRTIHPLALAELGDEACIVALGVARDLRSGVIPLEEFDMVSACGSVCCIVGHMALRMGENQARCHLRLIRRSPVLYQLFSGQHPSNPILAADAIERYVYDGSQMPWSPT